jgi:L-lactate dehydrogenase (cytochrome)
MTGDLSSAFGAVDSPRVVNIADLRLLAERRLPRAVFDCIDGGADAEILCARTAASSTT